MEEERRRTLEAVRRALTAGQGDCTEEEWAKAFQEVHANLIRGALGDLVLEEKVGLRFAEDGTLFYAAIPGGEFDFGDGDVGAAIEAILRSPPAGPA